VRVGGLARELGLPGGQRQNEGRQHCVRDRNRVGSWRTMHSCTMSHAEAGRVVSIPGGRPEAL
jgi:hypothetical protein